MARPFARKFYSSMAWRTCREEYAKRAHYLCENCLRRGIYRPGEIVHHKIEISPVNIERPEVTLNFDNLELLCRECHAERHTTETKTSNGRRRTPDRFRIEKDGTVRPRNAERIPPLRNFSGDH